MNSSPDFIVRRRLTLVAAMLMTAAACATGQDRPLAFPPPDARVRMTADVVYGNDAAGPLRMDVYRLPGDAATPALLFLIRANGPERRCGGETWAIADLGLLAAGGVFETRAIPPRRSPGSGRFLRNSVPRRCATTRRLRLCATVRIFRPCFRRECCRIRVHACRGVAQPGRALGSGSRGRRFESSRPDHFSHVFRVIPRLSRLSDSPQPAKSVRKPRDRIGETYWRDNPVSG